MIDAGIGSILAAIVRLLSESNASIAQYVSGLECIFACFPVRYLRTDRQTYVLINNFSRAAQLLLMFVQGTAAIAVLSSNNPEINKKLGACGICEAVSAALYFHGCSSPVIAKSVRHTLRKQADNDLADWLVD
jgi:hypothetical protein